MSSTNAHKSGNPNRKAIFRSSLIVRIPSLATLAAITASISALPVAARAQGAAQIEQVRNDNPGHGERARIEQQAQRDVDHLFAEAGIKRREVMLLGTFHFKDAGLDAYQPKRSFDALTDRRQKEIEEVVERLAKWNPAKVCVEFPLARQGELDDAFQAYLKGERNDRANETYQIGMRLAKRLGHGKVYAIDVWGRWYGPMDEVEEYAKQHGQEKLLTSALDGPQKEFLQRMDQAIDERHLRETLLYLNSATMITASHGVYLKGSFHVGAGEQYPGVDGFASSWYNRNLKIFENIYRASEPGDRVLVVIGAGHLPIIRHAVQSSPEFKLIEVADYLARD